MSRVLVIAWKELLQLRRDRLTFAMVVMLPIMQLLLFGYAINTDVRHIPTTVCDQDRSPASRDLVRRLEATGYYDIVGHVDGAADIGPALRGEQARVALVIPPRFGADLDGGRPATVQLIVDGSDPQTAGSATSTAASLVNARAARLVIARLSASGTTSLPITLEPATWYNPDLRTAVFIVPGLVGIILTMTMLLFTSMAMVRERERGTLEQLIVSPVRRFELVVGKIVPYIVIGYVQMSLIFAAGRVVFGVPFIGSLPLLYALASLFIAANLAIGLFFSTLARTQQQAMQITFFFFLPNILLSGFMFPFEAMPRPAQWLSTGLPLTHFLRIVRGIVLKGASLSELRHEVVALAIILTVLLILPTLRFRKKLS
jgi:ABC-2 type transport system permease protein